jgi:hypothetical protein
MTADDFYRMIADTQAKLAAIGFSAAEHSPRLLGFGLGVSVKESPLATQSTPVKKHKHRRGQSASYHRRVQKKWLKRFGSKHVPCMYMINDAWLGGSGKMLVVHPAFMKSIKGLAP